MAERVRLTGKAAGQRIDEDQPAVVMGAKQAVWELKHTVMVQAKVSEEDAQYLIDEGYWGYAMHQLRERVVTKNMQRETLSEEDDG